MKTLTDEDARQIVMWAVRTTAALTLLALPVVAWRMNWQSAVYLLVGAAISASGLMEWQRLMVRVMERMDAGGAQARPVGGVVAGFVLRMGLAVVVLYVTLSKLDGSIYALAAGLLLGLISLGIQAWLVMRG